MALQVVVYAMFKPLVPLYAQHLGASAATIGLIVALAFLPSLGLAIPVGAFVDRLGAVLFLRVGSVLFLLAPALLVLVPSMATLALVQVALGVAHLLVVVAAQSQVAGADAGFSREAAFGWFTTALSAGEITGPLIAGLIIDSAGFWLAFVVATCLGVGPLIGMLALRLPSSGATGGRRGDQPTFGSRAGRMLATPAVRSAIFSSATVLLAVVTLQTFLPVYLTLLAFPATAVGTLMSIQSFAAFSIRPMIGKLIKLFPSTIAALMVVLLLISVGLGTVSFAHTFAWMVVAVSLVGIGFGVSQPLSMALVIDNVSDQERGFALGFRISGNRVVQTSAPLILGLLGQVTGIGILFAVAAAAMVVITVQIARWSKG